MGMIEEAIRNGIQEGFEDSLADRCDGYHEPEERCPMRLSKGCACLMHRWRKLPWWRRLFVSRPALPDQGEILSVLISQEIEDQVTWTKADKIREQNRARGTFK
jgi:hypothetical protein